MFAFCWATVSKTVRPMLSDRCLSVCPVCLSVTFVHCGQTVGRIKIKLGMQVGLGPSHIVSDWDPLPKGEQATYSIGPYLLPPNGCMDQNVTWYGARPRCRHFMLAGDPALPCLKGHSVTARQISTNVPCRQTARWTKMPLGMEVGLGLRDIVLDGTQLPSSKRGQNPLPNFRTISIVVKPLDASRCHLVWR